MRYTQHKQASRKRKHIIFNRNAQCITRDPPTNYIPTDILTITENEIRTANTKPTREKQAKERENLRWYEKAPPNLQQLIGKTEIVFDDDDLEIPDKHAVFEIASDGGHDPQSGISTFGWVVAVNKQIIAKGRGPVEVHPELAESFHAERYGLASAGLFIKNLIQEFDVEVNRHTWKIYIDNS
jgi:hypothetical protein